MAATIIGILADRNVFHIPCARRVYGDMRIYLAMYPEVYEYPLPIYDDGGVVCNSYSGYRVSPNQKDFSGETITVVFDCDADYTSQPCGYPLCQYLVDGTDVVPEDVWRMRQDQRMPRYTVRYTHHFRKIAFESGVVLEDCPIKELDAHITHFQRTYGSEPVIYVGGNNLEPLAVYTSLVSQDPLKVVSRQCVDQITCDWGKRFLLPLRCVTSVWEAVVLLRTSSLKDAPDSVSLHCRFRKRFYDMLFDISNVKAGGQSSPLYVDHSK